MWSTINIWLEIWITYNLKEVEDIWGKPINREVILVIKAHKKIAHNIMEPLSTSSNYTLQ